MPASAFDPRQIHDVTEFLLDLPDTADNDGDPTWTACEEARFRTVPGRAYYAAFLVLKERMLAAHAFGEFPKQGVHGKVASAMRLVLGKTSRLVTRMAGLRDERTAADYEFPTVLTQARAESLADTSRDVVRAIDALTDSQVLQIAREVDRLGQGGKARA